MITVPIPTLHLFRPLEECLINLLRSLRADEWQLPTIAGAWTVKDVAAHLLDGNLRTAALFRDNYTGEPAPDISSPAELAAWLNQLNADFVRAMRRVSPATLISLMEKTGDIHGQVFEKLDPWQPARFAVSWAGEDVSANWFHIAREYTERWHHQQQIRDAVGRPGIQDRAFYYPVLDTFMRALPYTYRSMEAPAGTILQVTICGEAGGDWFLHKKEHWVVEPAGSMPVTAQISIPGEMAWKLFTKSWRKQDVEKHITITGSQSWMEPVLHMVAVVA